MISCPPLVTAYMLTINVCQGEKTEGGKGVNKRRRINVVNNYNLLEI